MPNKNGIARLKPKLAPAVIKTILAGPGVPTITTTNKNKGRRSTMVYQINKAEQATTKIAPIHAPRGGISRVFAQTNGSIINGDVADRIETTATDPVSKALSNNAMPNAIPKNPLPKI